MMLPHTLDVFILIHRVLSGARVSPSWRVEELRVHTDDHRGVNWMCRMALVNTSLALVVMVSHISRRRLIVRLEVYSLLMMHNMGVRLLKQRLRWKTELAHI
jgi:hypothetical protein